MIFRVFLRDVPATAEHVRPGRTLRLTDPLPGQKQEAKEGRVRRTGLPEPAQLLVGQHPIARGFRAAHELAGQPIDGGDLEIAGVDSEAQRGLQDLAAQYPGAASRGTHAQVQSITVAIPLIAVRGLEGAYSPIRQDLALRKCIRDTPWRVKVVDSSGRV
jgi:hypothetical protein